MKCDSDPCHVRRTTIDRSHNRSSSCSLYCDHPGGVGESLRSSLAVTKTRQFASPLDPCSADDCSMIKARRSSPVRNQRSGIVSTAWLQALSETWIIPPHRSGDNRGGGGKSRGTRASPPETPFADLRVQSTPDGTLPNWNSGRAPGWSFPTATSAYWLGDSGFQVEPALAPGTVDGVDAQAPVTIRFDSRTVRIRCRRSRSPLGRIVRNGG